MDEIWARGRKHVKVSKLYMAALFRRGPSIFVALAWSQVFWLVLEASAGNEDSRGYVRISSVVCYAVALHILAHFLLLRCRKLSHHAFEFILDLATDVVGFAWINVADEMLAQVFYVRAKTAFTYAVLSCFLSWASMAAGTGARDCLDWPIDFEETANQFVAGSFALPTSWLVTQAVHIGLYGFFYRTSAANGPQNGSGKGDGQEVDIHLAASLFFLVYALLCTAVASCVLGGTVAEAVAAGEVNAHGGDHGGGVVRTETGEGAGSIRGSSDHLLRAVEAGGPFTAALASDVEPSGRRGRESNTSSRDLSQLALTSMRGASSTSLRPRTSVNGGGDADDAVAGEIPVGSEERRDKEDVLASFPIAEEDALVEAVAAAARARGQSLRRGVKTYLRLTAGMMVGWAYNLWGQVEFRQEELEFRFGSALGATVYATIGTAVGVCIMVRGADRLDNVGIDNNSGQRQNVGVGNGHVNGDIASDDGNEAWKFWRSNGREWRRLVDNGSQRVEEWRKAVTALHAKRMLVVVGGVSLMVGWAWEEAFDLWLEAFLGDSADVGMILAKGALAVFSTVVVLGLEVVKTGEAPDHHGHVVGEGGHDGARADHENHELTTPLISTVDPHHGVN